MLMASLALHQVKDVGAVTQKEIDTKCKTLIYKFGFDIFRSRNGCNSALKKPKLCRGHMLSNQKKT